MRQVVGELRLTHREPAGGVAVADRTRVRQVEPGQVARHVADHDARRLLRVVEERHPDQLLVRESAGERHGPRFRTREVHHHGLRPRCHVGARPLGDPEQQHGLVPDLRDPRVDRRDDFEARL